MGLVGAFGFLGTSIKSSNIFKDFNIQPYGRQNPITSEKDFHGKISTLDSIIWTASLTNPSIAESRLDLVELELENWRNLLDRLTSSKLPIPKMVFISSGGCVYSGSNSSFVESDTADGSNAYGRLKSRMERALIESDIPHSIIRAANVYGPNQPTGRGQGVVAEWVSASKLGLPIKVFGDSGAHRDFIYISDFLNAIKLVVESDHCLTVNIGSGKSESLATLIKALQTHSPLPLDISYHSSRGFDRHAYQLDISLANKYYGWAPTVSLENGISKCFSLDID
jgi:UDP-glucose 4-epimerase